jgi:DNA-binding GntR family transcriptional regulator
LTRKLGTCIVEFGIQARGDIRLRPLELQPALIDRAYERLVEAIADGTLAPGQRVRQEELGRALGVSRQPISHALQLLKQQKLVEENGRRGLIVSEIDAARVRELYQVRSALDALAARLAAERIAGRVTEPPQRRAAQQASRCTRMPRCWHSSRPMSRFTLRFTVCPVAARSKTLSRRNGRI